MSFYVQIGRARFTWEDSWGFSLLVAEQEWGAEQGGVRQQFTVLSRRAERVISVLILLLLRVMKLGVSIVEHTHRKMHRHGRVSS